MRTLLLISLIATVALFGCDSGAKLAHDAQTPEQAASMVEKTHKFLQLCDANGGIAKYDEGRYVRSGRSSRWQGATIVCKNGLAGYLDGAP